MIKWFSEDLFDRSYLRYFLLSIPAVVLTSAIAYASEGGGHEDTVKLWIDFAWRVFDFGILIWFLYWVAAKKIKEFFFDRRDNIKAAIEEKITEKEDTEKKFREYSLRLDKATEEIKGIFEMIKAQGLTEKEKIIEDAKKAAAKMIEDTQARMEQELKAARNQLRSEAAELSVAMAEELLKKNINRELHENMVKDYLDKVVKKH
ncbi:MAG: ATP synthase F0 subunit B [Syntrophales bacterium]|jgi:F-type H+-transporting ATPase subunit b